jgi:hypothetical protein
LIKLGDDRAELETLNSIARSIASARGLPRFAIGRLSGRRAPIRQSAKEKVPKVETRRNNQIIGDPFETLSQTISEAQNVKRDIAMYENSNLEPRSTEIFTPRN